MKIAAKMHKRRKNKKFDHVNTPTGFPSRGVVNPFHKGRMS